MLQPTVGANMAFLVNNGTVAVPVWLEISEIGDLNISDMSRNLAELKRRANAFTKNLPALINSISVEFKLLHGLGAVVHAQLRAAFFSGIVKQYAISSFGMVAVDSEVLLLPALVESFPWNQPLEQATDHDVRLATGYMVESNVEIDPEWQIVT